MNSWFTKPMKAHARFEFTKDEDIEFFICQNILSMPQPIFDGYRDYVVSHYEDCNTVNIYGLTEDDKDLLSKRIKEYSKQMRDQGIDTIEKIKDAF